MEQELCQITSGRVSGEKPAKRLLREKRQRVSEMVNVIVSRGSIAPQLGHSRPNAEASGKPMIAAVICPA